MIRTDAFVPKFVEFIPDRLEPGVLYISLRFNTVLHRCACGCGSEVATPLSPAQWRLDSHGNAVSLYPSIGSWSLPCRSHYWIRRNRVKWARPWSELEVRAGRERDSNAVDRYVASVQIDIPGTKAEIGNVNSSLWERFKRWWFKNTG
jgi:uncharacterized protein DUF6527